jgi:hypothetical protein
MMEVCEGYPRSLMFMEIYDHETLEDFQVSHHS